MSVASVGRSDAPVMSRRKQVVFAIVSILLGVAMFLFAAEVVLRFLPVTSALHSLPVNAQNPLLLFKPNRNFVYSQGWKFDDVVHGRVNRQGWVNDQDYVRDDPLPLLAIVGDSLIQASMVPSAETVQGRLASALAGKSRVYSFGTAAAPPSHYLPLARHAVREYGARAVVINIAGNDFDQSHARYRDRPGFWFYVPDQAGELRLMQPEYTPRFTTSILRESALVRYLMLNLNIDRVYESARTRVRGWITGKAPPGAKARQINGTSVSLDERRMKASLAVIDAFFRDLPTVVGLPPERVLFTMDGYRYPEAAAAGKGSYFDVMQTTFRAAAESRGYEFIDLDDAFFRRHAQTAERFEFPKDSHWTALGHGVVADAVQSSRFYERLFGPAASAGH